MNKFQISAAALSFKTFKTYEINTKPVLAVICVLTIDF